VVTDASSGFGVVPRIGRAGVRGDLEALILVAQARRQLCRHPLPRAEQEQTKTPPGAHGGDRLHQVHAGHWIAELTALTASGPYDAGPVGEAEIGVLEDPGERGVFLGAHHELRVDGGHQVRAAGVDKLLDPFQGRRRVQAVDAHPENPCGVRHDRYLKVVLQMGTTRATVAVDINPATRPVVTGTETFTREVCRRLPEAAPEVAWRFLASRPARARLGVDVTVLPFRRGWSQVRLPMALAADRPDLLFVPAHVIPFAWWGRSLTVVHDLAFEIYPDAYGATERAYLRATTAWAVARCKVLIAVSESTRQDLIDRYHVDPERVRVVPLGIATPARPKASSPSALVKLGVDGDFVLQVGRVEARKNQGTALAAVEQLDGVTLVVAGPTRDPALASRLASSKWCRVLGAVDAATLDLLYERAAAVLVPSLYEGFGLPVLEAMARGKVVVAGNVSALPEVGGEAALYFADPKDAAGIARVLEVALTDRALRRTLAAAATARAAEFTWERTAKAVATVIKEALTS
jgi:glycosyltransferase involved in cell wall biosynthesis